ncbi:MAG: hypothetical protein AB1427_00140 [Thermodesulfobacteriota bacterium]
MTSREAVMAFSQSEKIKAGLIWASQAAEQSAALPELEKKGASGVIRTMLAMISHELHLAAKLGGGELWREIEKHVDMAMVMIDSQVLSEAAFHLTRALSRTTTIGQRAMMVLRENRLI